MELGSWFSVVGGVCGAVVAIYGAEILVVGRATPGDRRAFRRLADAGRFYLFFGLALVALASGSMLNGHDESVLAVPIIIGAVALAGLAIRYRPRKNERR